MAFVTGTAGNDTVSPFGVSPGVVGVPALNAFNDIRLLGGNDSATGGDVDDAIFGDDGNDTLNGGGQFGDDSLNGGAGDDSLSGAAGDDVLDGGGDDDTLNGFVGDDTLLGGDGDDVINAGEGNDFIFAGSGLDIVEGDGVAGIGNDTIVGSNDIVADFFEGGVGDDVFRDLFDDVADGGDGFDEVDLSGIGTAVTLEFIGNDFVTSDVVVINGAIVSNMESFLAANDFDSTISGTRANPTVRLVVDLTVFDGLRIGTFTANGVPGAGTVSFQVINFDNVVGTANNDRLTGASVENVLDGAGGDDVLRGEEGNDTLFGGAGADVLNGGADIDAASYTTAASGVTVNLGNVSLNTGDAAGDTYTFIETIFGSNFNDRLIGAAGVDSLIGGLGDDTLNGGDGGDTLGGGSGNDSVVGGAGGDSLLGAVGIDTLSGGAGNDTLTGGQSSDQLTGGAGRDTFVIGGLADGVDTITDFNAARDTIQLGAGFGLPDGPLAATAFQASSADAATSAAARIVYDTDNGALYFDADGVGGAAAVLFAALVGAPTLTAADFVVVG